MKNFGTEDIKLLRSAIQKLKSKEHKAIVYRYWNCLTIDEIAAELRISWEETDILIKETQKKLKKLILKMRRKNATI